MTEAALVASFVVGVSLLVLGAAMLAPVAGVLTAGAALALVPTLYVRGRRFG